MWNIILRMKTKGLQAMFKDIVTGNFLKLKGIKLQIKANKNNPTINI